MKDYLYILKLDNDEVYVTKTLTSLYNKIEEYCNLNNVDIMNLNVLKLQNILNGLTKNSYNYIKELKRIKRYDYVKDELLLRFPDCESNPTSKRYYINRILKKRGIE